MAPMALSDSEKNEGMLCDQIAVLKRDASFNESDIDALKKQVESLKKEKESIKIKVDGFENASKSLVTLIGSQVSINNKKGVGFDNYNVIAPPPTGLFAPPTFDFKKFKHPEFEGSGVHSLFLDGTSIQINMLVEKKYPLKKAILEKMINLKLEAEEESSMAHELLKFIKSHIEEQS
ncbi:hypothetical protein Tco_1576746 [Tanacetum coccineum]